MGGMVRQRVGILHPGAMGARVGEQAVAAGAEVWWVAAGRSAASRARADAAGLQALDSLEALAARCHIILSICPPAAALSVARSVADTSFDGVYADANAISPEHAVAIAGLFAARSTGDSAAGVRVVDGGIVGGPPRRRTTEGTIADGGDASARTRLYLSGPDAAAVDEVRALFDGTALDARVLAGPVGQASALKLSFAAFNKISYLLAAQSYGLAAGHGVLDELLSLASDVVPGTMLARPDQVVTAGPRAWRWAPEMDEIAAACADAGVSGDVAALASTLFARWAELKDADADPAADPEGDAVRLEGLIERLRK